MNPKLIKYRDEKATANGYVTPYSLGFSAAIELNLAVEFAEWQRVFIYQSKSNDKWHTSIKQYNESFNNMDEVFEFWLTNIWTDKK